MARLEAVTPADGRRLALPRFGLGCAPIGDLYHEVDPDVAAATVHAAVDGGATLIDTAPLYGDGLSERRVGRALATVDRARFQLSTKVGWQIAEGAEPRHAFGRDDVLRSLEGSMERLGVDRFDVVHVHDPEDHLDEAVRHAVPALLRLRDEGVVGAVGAGMNHSAPLAELVRRTDLDVVLIAGRYTLLEQPALAGLLPLCAERGVGVIAAGVFNSGLLADPGPARRTTTTRYRTTCCGGRWRSTTSAHGTGCRCGPRPSSSRSDTRPWCPSSWAPRRRRR